MATKKPKKATKATKAKNATKAATPPTDAAIDGVIRKNLKKFAKPGVVSVRPGLRISNGMLTNQPAIVASVRRKIANIPPKEKLPPSVGGISVDVRQLSAAEAMRATDPEGFAQELLRVPRGNVPVELQTPNFAHERNLKGELIGPKVDKAVARVRPQRPDGLVQKTKYQKLPASQLQPVTEATVTCFASPDAGWPNLQPFLTSVKKTLTVGMFEFTAPHIVSAVTGAMKGKALNLVLDDPDYDTTAREQTNDATLAKLQTAVGKGLNFAWAAETADKHNSIHLFPAAYHIKVAVADSSSFFLSSGNFNSTNQPDIDPIKNPGDKATNTAAVSDRDWHVIVESPALSATFEKLILRDLQQALPGQQAAAAPVLKGNGNTTGKHFPKFFPGQTFKGAMTIQPAVTPDNFGIVILPLIQNAQKRFWMQTQYIKPSASFVKDVATLAVPKRSILEQFLDALRVITAKGVDVRIIVDSRVTASTIEQLQKTGGLDGKNILRQEHIHNKGMIVDDHTVVIGSQNWSTEGVDTNRDASVVIQNPNMVTYWEAIFLSDWQAMTLPNEDPAS
jgi:phosphatidylserine/phosphatidylglycerophosphate/cardiolipin synthase-like enzyme